MNKQILRDFTSPGLDEDIVKSGQQRKLPDETMNHFFCLNTSAAASAYAAASTSTSISAFAVISRE
jgi:hypothetical protein